MTASRMVALAAATGALALAPSASAALTFKSCGLTDQAVRTQCATADLPMDYDNPSGPKVHIKIGRVPVADPHNRLGVMFFNFGGPGRTAVDYLPNTGG